jgi:serine/threonine protein kinase
VWEAKQLSLNRLVAVKVDRRTLETDAEQRRFLREAGAAGRMSGHPGIVTVHDAGILTDDRPYLVMALCEGGSLTKWVKGEPRPSQEEVREVGVRIADALAATHARGVLHRDVKPANILIDSYGHVGLADFGLAALPDPGMELSETLEAITPAYAPPEVFHRRPPTAAGDVYSLGATLYAVLSGRPPHWPENGTPNVLDVFERLEDPIDRIPGVDDEFMDALLAALAFDPADRPSAEEFRDRLSALTLGTPTTNGKSANGHPAAALGPGQASASAAIRHRPATVATSRRRSWWTATRPTIGTGPAGVPGSWRRPWRSSSRSR